MKLILIVPASSFLLSLAACGTAEDAPRRAPAQPAVSQTAAPSVGAAPAGTAAPAPTPIVVAPSSPSPQAAAAATPEGTTTATSDTGDKLQIRRLVLASRVVEREPELALTPRVNEPLMAFVEAKNDASEEERLIVTFEHESGKKVGFVELRVPGGTNRYRTWARTRNLNEPGNWAAVVRSEGGTELGRTSFTVTES
jgi:hypothetical protein